MRKIERLEDHAEHLINLSSLLKRINEAINDREYELAKMLASRIKISATFLDLTLEKLK